MIPMRSWTTIPLALALLVPAGRLGAQIEYVPISYDVAQHYASPVAKYKVADGRLQVEVSSQGVAADKSTNLPYLHLRMKVENKASAVATVSASDQQVAAEGWGELRPEYATRNGSRVPDPVAVGAGKSVTLDLYYGMGHIVDPATTERFTLRWDVGLPGGSYTGETLFRQADVYPYAGMPYYGPYYGPGWPWRPWRFDPFFARPVGPFFFDPFFNCDPIFGTCGRPIVVRLRDRDDQRVLDKDDLGRVPDRDDLGRSPEETHANPVPPAMTGANGPAHAGTVMASLGTTPGHGAAGPQGGPWPALTGVMPRQSTSAAIRVPGPGSTFSRGPAPMGPSGHASARMRSR